MKKILIKALTLVIALTPIFLSYPASAASTWNLVGNYTIDYTCVTGCGGVYTHTMNITTENMSTGDFSGTGYYNPDTSYTWTVTGNTTGNNITFHVLYTGSNVGYYADATGTIAPNGSMSGTASSSANQTFTWTTGTGQAQPAQTSTVTICKTNTAQQQLSGWTLMLKGDLVQSGLTVPTNISSGINSISLDSGTSYVATASGTWSNQVGANLVDTEYSTTDNWATYMDGYTGYQTDILELQINSQFDPNSNWGAYNSAHTYAQSFVPTTTGSANFRIFDGTGTTQNEGWFGDNSGTLSVDINKGFADITGEGGCVTFQNVPYGDYTIGELSQDNWASVSGLGAVTINAVTQSFTVVNRDTTIIPTGHLIVQKTTYPAGDNTNFAITATGDGTITGGGAGTVSDATDQTYEVTPGTYSVTESTPTGWQLISNDCTGIIIAAGEIKTCTIVNNKLGQISGMKYNDLNRNGKKDPNEPGLAGWTIKLKNDKTDFITTTVTDSNGNYTFTNLVPGSYIAREVHQKGWRRMSKNPKKIKVTIGTTVENINFGNALKKHWEHEDTNRDDEHDDSHNPGFLRHDD